MTIEYDEKGKYYTETVTKMPVSATIQTTVHLVRGFVHVRQGERLKNELERDDTYLAVTDARICGPDDNVLFTADFLAIQRNQIVWIMPADADVREDGGA